MNLPIRRRALAAVRHLIQQRYPSSRRGNAAIEFAIIAPLLALILAGTIEIGTTVITWFRVQEGVLDGANYASHNGWNATAITTAVTTSSPKLATATVSVTRFCGCPVGSNITKTADCDTVSSPGVCPSGCSATCSDGVVNRKYAAITAAVPRTTYMTKSFGLPATVSVTMKTKLP
ncbi:MAG: hypothetical protein RIQ99_1459 [Pseudomonadota bacterium]|jgi:Flp pilus assembly protein TadG